MISAIAVLMPIIAATVGFWLESEEILMIAAIVVPASCMWLLFHGLLVVWGNLKVRSVPFTKRSIVIATILWPTGVFVGCFLAVGLFVAGIPESEWILTKDGGFIPRSVAVESAVWSGMKVGFVCPTVAYAFSMIVLFVLWFAMRPE